MASTSTIPENRVPAGARVVEPTCCENCSRTLYREVKKKKICPACVSIFEMYAQLWCCGECGTARKYGEGRPEETAGKQLRCVRCCQVTRHEFLAVFRGQVVLDS